MERLESLEGVSEVRCNHCGESCYVEDLLDGLCPTCEDERASFTAISYERECTCSQCDDDYVSEDEEDEGLCPDCQESLDLARQYDREDILEGLCEEFGATYKDVIFCPIYEEWDIFGKRYEVLDETEAEERCQEYIKELLWAFNPSFLSDTTGLPQVIFESLSNLYEGANEAVEALIEATCGMDDFCSEAVSADGITHFMEDANEISVDSGYFYVIRA